MLPPLFLNAQHDHLTLDMCAAPGSKTAQLLEAIHAPLLDPQGHIPPQEGQLQPAPLGIVIANDSDYKRANLLKHQASRFASPNLMVTNSDARFFPELTVAYNPTGTEKLVQRHLRYDRILCDVPCSGDGTVRKNVMIWRDWTYANGNGLHKMQLQILLRGLDLLADGGRLVYSTCSLNPIENEAVVAEALRTAQTQGMHVELVDTRSHPEFAPFAPLVRYPGVTDWKVCPLKNFSQLRQAQRKQARGDQQHHQGGESHVPKEEAATTADSPATATTESAAEGGAKPTPKDEEPKPEQQQQEEMEAATETEATGPKMPWFSSWDDVAAEFPHEAEKVPKSFWPQGDEEQLNIPRCMRIYPHLQNTGGFFVAVFHKAGSHQSMAPGIVRGQAMTDAQEPREAEQEHLNEANAEQARAPSAAGKRRAAAESEKGEGEEQTPAKRLKLEDNQATPASTSIQGQQPADDTLEQQRSTSSVETKHLKPATQEQQQQQPKSTPAIKGDPSRLKEDAFTFVSPSQSDIAALQQTYQFPIEWARNFMVRNAEGQPVRIIYFSTPVVRAIITGGVQGPFPPEETRHRWPQTVKMRLIFTGNRLFVRQGSEKQVRTPLERWRIPEEGEALIRPYLAPERLVSGLTLVDLAYLIQLPSAHLATIPEQSQLRQMGNRMSIGSYIFTFQPERGPIQLHPLPPPPPSQASQKEGEDAVGASSSSVAAASPAPPATTTSTTTTTVEKPSSSTTTVPEPEPATEVQARLDTVLHVPVWRAPNSIVLMLDKRDKSAMSFRLFGSDLSSPTGERFRGKQGKPKRAAAKQDFQQEPKQQPDEVKEQGMATPSAALLDDLDAAVNDVV